MFDLPAATVLVKISAASARLQFITCGPACIAAGCNGNCCDAPTRPSGCLVTIHPTEAAAIERKGGVIVDNLLQPRPGTRGCPFKSLGLCKLHFSPDKPFGCKASPFTLNKNMTLVVRNRYKMLPCYKGNAPKRPAYIAFRDSLVTIFGEERTSTICTHLGRGRGDYLVHLERAIVARLVDNDIAKKAAAHV